MTISLQYKRGNPSMSHGETTVKAVQNIEESCNRDAELIARCQSHDEEAFQELVDSYRSRVASVAYKVLGNYMDAQDVTQEVFVKLHRRIGAFDPQKKFFTWLYRLTVNAAIDFLRSKKRRLYDDSIDERPEYFYNLPVAEVNSVSLDYERQELRHLLKKMAGDLNPREKDIFILCDLHGFSADEVSDILDLKKVTLRWNLHKARKKIRAEIKEHYPEYWRGQHR